MKTTDIVNNESRLDSFDAKERRKVVRAMAQAAGKADGFPEPKPVINLHAHTFFSYNCYGYSPTRFAWLARKAGLEAAGIVDFDVLDGLAEFLECGRILGLKTVVGVESRVYVPEFKDFVINSPGEPGIAYHMGSGFTTSKITPWARNFLERMKNASMHRSRNIVMLVNGYMRPLELNWNKDILPLTPNGNVTERHMCLAYARKAAAMFKKEGELARFWSDKLHEPPEKFDLPDGPALQNLVRAKTMKQGGVGYTRPDVDAFPLMADLNRFALESGAVPMVTWLDGLSEGEQKIGQFMDIAMSTGTAAINIIPDRNFKPGVKDVKLQNLYDIVKLAESRDLPVVCGTEMNSPGQKFVDAFDSAELSPLRPVFLRGVRILYAHTVLQAGAGMGYLSDWARKSFGSVKDKNDFFEELGKRARPANAGSAAQLTADCKPDQALKTLA